MLVSCDKKDVFGNTVNKIPAISTISTFGGSKNDVAQAIINTNDGGYAILGHTQSSDFDINTKTNDSFDFWVLKFDSNHELEWSKTFGGSDDDRGTNLVQTNDNGFLITGFSRSSDGDISENAGNYDFWVAKLDVTGQLIWEKSFGYTGADQSYAIKKIANGGYLLGGSLDVTASGGQGNSKSQKHAGGDFWLIKIDENGNNLWSKYFGGQFTDILYDIEETDSGDFILVGSSDSDDADISNNIGSYDFWVLKVDKDGSKIWEKNFGGSQADEAFSIVKTSNNQFLIAGNSRSSDVNVSVTMGSSDIWLIKIDSDGNLLWEKSFGGSSFEIAKKIIKNNNQEYYIVGSSRSSDIGVLTNQGNKDVWIISVNENGTINWQKSMGGTELDEANSVIETNKNEIIVAGETWSFNGDISENKGFSDALIIKIK